MTIVLFLGGLRLLLLLIGGKRERFIEIAR
jgi:hypothetical protein